MEVTLSAAQDAANRFAIQGSVREVTEHPGGKIHASFVVMAGSRRYLLQSVNTHVFTQPELVMENVAAVTAHLVSHGERTPAVIGTREGGMLWRDETGGVWRMFEFIDRATTMETARGTAEAERAAAAFGRFQRVLADYAGPALHVTIPAFHDTGARLAALDQAIEAAPPERRERAQPVTAALETLRSEYAGFFGSAAERKGATGIAHHDAKIANVLFDSRTGEALCVVDFDTVMPGPLLVDFGDLVRSMATSAAEDERDAADVAAEPVRYGAITRGYLRHMADRLTEEDRSQMPMFGETMVFEQTVRFVTDYLDGDRYYRVTRAEHNLDRAWAQLSLLRSLREQHATFSRLVKR